MSQRKRSATPLNDISKNANAKRPGRILMIRRGIKNADAVVEQAKSRGFVFETELTPNSTHIISNWPLEKVLKWLKLDKLPNGVQFRDSKWLCSQ